MNIYLYHKDIYRYTLEDSIEQINTQIRNMSVYIYTCYILSSKLRLVHGQNQIIYDIRLKTVVCKIHQLLKVLTTNKNVMKFNAL